MSPEGRRISIQDIPSEFGSDDERGLNTIDTIVIHSMYNPNRETPYAVNECKAILDEYEVSTHYLVDREGVVWRYGRCKLFLTLAREYNEVWMKL
jgi:N-acetyl-anhydromuramyl-L-alanine amidase AmpD